jgi:hypothetical protein
MAIKANFSGANIKLPGGSPTVRVEIKPGNDVKYVELSRPGGGRRMELIDTERRLNDDYALALVYYKSMAELMTEFPNHFFDQYGNFNTGVTEGSNYSQTNGIYDHLAPSYFGQMGMTIHRPYLKSQGIQDTWYSKVIDR